MLLCILTRLLERFCELFRGCLQAKDYWHEHSLPVIGETPDAVTLSIGIGTMDVMSPPGTFWNL